MSGNMLRMVCLAAAVLYYAAFASSFLKKPVGAKISHALWICGAVLNGVIVANNWIVNGYVPFVSMYQVLTFLGVTFSFVYIYIRYVCSGAFMKRYFIIVQAVIMTGVFFMDQNSVWHFPPALQAPYFIPHVLSYMIAYTLVAVAAILSVMSFVRKGEVRKLYREGVYTLARTGLPFSVLGTLLGALWANACWGNYWTWDLKEAWALLTVLSLTLYLHFRRHESLRKYAEWFVILTFVFEIITLFFVSMFSGGSAHAYS